VFVEYAKNMFFYSFYYNLYTEIEHPLKFIAFQAFEICVEVLYTSLLLTESYFRFRKWLSKQFGVKVEGNHKSHQQRMTTMFALATIAELNSISGFVLGISLVRIAAYNLEYFPAFEAVTSDHFRLLMLFTAIKLVCVCLTVGFTVLLMHRSAVHVRLHDVFAELLNNRNIWYIIIVFAGAHIASSCKTSKAFLVSDFCEWKLVKFIRFSVDKLVNIHFSVWDLLCIKKA